MRIPASRGIVVLAADIGGTNCCLALVDARGAAVTVRHRVVVPTRDNRGLDDALQAFTGAARSRGIRVLAAGFSAAGPVAEGGGRLRLTNADLTLSRAALERSLRVPVVLLNDFEANASGVETLRARDVAVLHRGSPAGPVKVLLGPGTGLGVAFVTADGPHASEGGNSAAAAQSPRQRRILDVLARRLRREILWGDVLSGPGLVNLYWAATALRRQRHPTFQARLRRTPKAEQPKFLTAHSDVPDVADALEAAVGFFAGKAQDVALAFLPFGGIYLCGSVTDALAPSFRRHRFIARFLANRTHRALLRRVPIYHVRTGDLGLCGAAVRAAQVAPR